MTFGSTPDWFHLSDGDDIVWESRPHPVTMGVALPVGLLFVLVGFALLTWGATDGGGWATWAGVALAAVGAVVVLVRYAFWTNTRYVITSAELYTKRGVVSRDVTQFRLDRVQNTSLRQTAVGRLLGYGDLTVYTAGSGDPELVFERVPSPERASQLLSDQLEDVESDRRVV